MSKKISWTTQSDFATKFNRAYYAPSSSRILKLSYEDNQLSTLGWSAEIRASNSSIKISTPK